MVGVVVGGRHGVLYIADKLAFLDRLGQRNGDGPRGLPSRERAMAHT